MLLDGDQGPGAVPASGQDPLAAELPRPCSCTQSAGFAPAVAGDFQLLDTADLHEFHHTSPSPHFLTHPTELMIPPGEMRR